MNDATTTVEADDPRPQAPNPEDYSDCCDSGCSPCVFDLYWDAVARFEIQLADWRARHGITSAEST
jgi:hypothetical protein